MDLRGFRMTVCVEKHPEYKGLGDYFGTGKMRPKRSGIRRNLDQWVAFAEALAKERSGILPYMEWIEKNHSGLGTAMRKHPDRFKHIPQEKPREHYRTPEQWVPFAQALANEHGGVLPHVRWIRKKHSGLARAIRDHPELFFGLRQEVRNEKGRIVGYRVLGEEREAA